MGRYGKFSGIGACECTASSTCRACLVAAGPTKGEAAPVTTLADSIPLRVARIRAYKAGRYLFRAPPVCTAQWNDEAWQNFVTFTEPGLTGVLSYNAAKQAEAERLAAL